MRDRKFNVGKSDRNDKHPSDFKDTKVSDFTGIMYEHRLHRHLGLLGRRHQDKRDLVSTDTRGTDSNDMRNTDSTNAGDKDSTDTDTEFTDTRD
jgi:hypothetical protein